ncbi:MAG: Gfo/Idh/MocA family oxidoreductase [Spirochaetales bacterium]|nr:Gfo/Idh/MocA family oxidoreductase [Spirochaetales bacterium]
MKNKINCSIIGLGRIGTLLEQDKKREKPATHAGAIHHNRDCQLLSGCDIEEEQRRLFQQTWKCPHIFSNYLELLDFKIPDILHIATPPQAHFEICREAIIRGVPVVICEKPFTLSINEAREIESLVKKSSTKIIINHERRYSRDYNDVKKIIDSKHFGALLNISAKLCMGYSRAPRDLLWHDGTHMVDILRFLVDQELEFRYFYGDLDKKTSSCDIGFMAGSIPVHLLAATDRKYLMFEMDLFFEQALIRIGNGVFEILKSKPSPFYDSYFSLISSQNRRYKTTGYFSNMMKEAVELSKVENLHTTPRSNVNDGVKSIEIIKSLLL